MPFLTATGEFGLGGNARDMLLHDISPMPCPTPSDAFNPLIHLVAAVVGGRSLRLRRQLCYPSLPHAPRLCENNEINGRFAPSVVVVDCVVVVDPIPVDI